MTQQTMPPLGPLPAGAMIDYLGPIVPPRFYEADGSSVARFQNPQLFNALNPSLGAVTVTSASPGVVTTSAAHGLRIGDRVFFENTGGALPTGITADLGYFVRTVPTSTTFTLGTTRTVNVQDGTVAVTVQVNTSSTGTGVHTCFWSPYGVADSSHFNLPDARGDTTMGQVQSTAYHVLGITVGETSHTLAATESGQKGGSTTIEQSDHHHSIQVATSTGGAAGDFTVPSNLTPSGGLTATGGVSANHIHNLTASAAALGHNTVQPTIVMKKIIYRGPA